MDLVFRFAQRITVLVPRRGLRGGHAEGDRRQSATCARSISGRPAMASALELRGVSAGYGETVVLEDIDLALAPGECISVIGRNGVGKTTLLATVMGHTTLHKGEVMLDGSSLDRMPIYARALARHRLRAAGARDFPFAHGAREPRHRRATGRTGRRSGCSICFRTCTERLGNMGNQLSGGEQQMLAIARALLTNPSVLLMDEPTEGLAPVIVETLTAVLVRLRAESALSIVLVEQNSSVALAFSERTVVMSKGRIVYDGPSAALRDDPERLAQLVGVTEAGIRR